jgi:hypothetical protein
MSIKKLDFLRSMVQSVLSASVSLPLVSNLTTADFEKSITIFAAFGSA